MVRKWQLIADKICDNVTTEDEAIHCQKQLVFNIKKHFILLLYYLYRKVLFTVKQMHAKISICEIAYEPADILNICQWQLTCYHHSDTMVEMYKHVQCALCARVRVIISMMFFFQCFRNPHQSKFNRQIFDVLKTVNTQFHIIELHMTECTTDQQKRLRILAMPWLPWPWIMKLNYLKLNIAAL